MAEAELKARSEEMKAAWRAGDIDKLMSMYCDDCSFTSNKGGDIQKGKAQIRKTVAEYLDKYSSCEVDSIDRTICGKCCTDIGYFTCTKKAGGTVDKGKYMAGFVKRDGQWYLRYDFVCF